MSYYSLRITLANKKRINKLLGKQEEEPKTRSRIDSQDFIALDEFSCLKNIKHNKKNQLSRLKNDGIPLIFT